MTIQIEIKGNRIHLLSAYPVAGLGRIIPGSSFSKVNGPHWSIPLSLQACRALRERFGADLRVGRELSAWAREAIQAEARMAALGRADDADLLRVPEVSPKLSAAMATRTYQRAGARFVAMGREVLIAHEPGLGKTLIAIAGIIESGVPGPYLVITPKTAVENVWAREIPRWWDDASVITTPDGKSKRNEILTGFANLARMNAEGDARGVENLLTLERTFLVLHPEMIRTSSWWVCPKCGLRSKYKAGPKELDCALSSCGWVDPGSIKREDEHLFPQIFAIDWGAIVADESDRMLLRKTGTPTQTRRGAELLRTRPEGLRVAMSGTPFRSRPHLLWGTLNWLRPQQYSGFWRWAETYYELNRGWAGTHSIGSLRSDKRDSLSRDLSGIMLRRTKAEVASDMPPKTYVGTPLVPGDESSPVGVWLSMSRPQQALYDKMRQESMVALSGGDLNAIGVLAEITRLKQFATACGKVEGDEYFPALPSNKLEYLLEKLGEMGFPEDPETKIVIASQYTKTLNLFVSELSKNGIQAYSITGSVSARERTRIINNFNEPVKPNGTNVLALQTKTGGVAITLDHADHMFIIDETFINDDQVQLEDRIHRVSKPRPVFYHYLRSLDSIEVSIAETNAERARESHDILDAHRGLEYARRILERL